MAYFDLSKLNVFIYTTNQRSNCQTLFLYYEKQNIRQTITGQKFRRRQKFVCCYCFTVVLLLRIKK